MQSKHSPSPPLPESTHPYVVRVSLKLGSNVELDLPEERARLPFANKYILQIVQEHAHPREQANFIKRITLQLEAFPSASEAERAGKLLAVSLLWIAASKRVTIEFEKRTGDFPFEVQNRSQTRGLSFRAEGRVHSEISAKEFTAVAEEFYILGGDLAPNVLTSMEFYASARMESSPQATFLGLMTAFEALAVQVDYGDEIGDLLSDLATQLEKSTLLAGEEKASLRNSLAGRLRKLREESVRQAIVRLVREYSEGQEIVSLVDQAYGIRSKLLHEGIRAPEMYALTTRLEDIVRQIYSSMLGLKLERPPFFNR